MLGIPSLGSRVKVWPAPGKKVQLGERALDSGGRWMSPAGEPVIFSVFHVEQLRAGDIMLHPPACDEHDFGEESDGGKMERDACRLCGRDMKNAQEYDARIDEAKKKAEADQKAAEEAAAAAAAAKAKADADAAAATPAPHEIHAETADQPKDKE